MHYLFDMTFCKDIFAEFVESDEVCYEESSTKNYFDAEYSYRNW